MDYNITRTMAAGLEPIALALADAHRKAEYEIRMVPDCRPALQRIPEILDEAMAILAAFNATVPPE